MTVRNTPVVQHWALRSRKLCRGQLPLLMGIVNVTPDSFSDGGRFFDAAEAVRHGLELVAQGADILDVGGESTRPGAEPVDAAEELRRVLPVVESLRRQTDVALSIDTNKATVAQRALDAGAEIINDITALTGDPAMLPVAAQSGCGVCIMHMQGTPRTMQESPSYADVVEEVLEYLRRRRDALLAAGIPQDRIAIDPGIGFGKTAEHNRQLVANAWRFHAMGCPVLIGHSRKRFLTALLQEQATVIHSSHAASASPISMPTPADRTAATVGVALALARQGVQILRVHDVAVVREALILFQAAGGFGS
jgi:dihydropteroate synthase